MAKKLPEIYIRRDLREKDGQGWYFDSEDKKPGKVRILGTTFESMDAADYSIQGYEDLVRIERKMGFRELFTNLFDKDNKERFEIELTKLSSVKYKYLIVESSINEDIMSLSVPQYKGYGPPTSKIINMLYEYQLDFDIIPIFAGDCGKKIAAQIFKSIAHRFL